MLYFHLSHRPYKCTPLNPRYAPYDLSRQHFPNAAGYGLDYLSKSLNLKVKGKRFNSAQAHTARYDAEFTYHLYNKIVENQQREVTRADLRQTHNPFSSSRVDTPFQDHVDLSEVYQSEFEFLKSILKDVKADRNQQSKAAVVIGEAGTGKTHLMMRLAKETLRTNRLLFIRQPNHADAVLYHIYARVLESLAEKVLGGDRTQLELLLANSFVKILNVEDSQKSKDIVAALQNNSLSLFARLGTEGSQKNADNWEYIERKINLWWTSQYSAAGDAAKLIKGIIKFCRYTDPKKKELTRRWLAASELEEEEAKAIGLDNWQNEISREEFALEAIGVFGKLSTLDEPLIIVFDQLEGLGLAHNAAILESFGAAVKEILTHVPNSLVVLNLFPDRWEQFKSFFDGSVVDRVSQHEVWLNRISSEKLEQILQLKAQSTGIDWDTLFQRSELDDILNQKSVRSALNLASAYFRYKAENIPLPPAQSPQPLMTKSISLEARVTHLEAIVQQMSSLVAPALSGAWGTENSQGLRRITAEAFVEIAKMTDPAIAAVPMEMRPISSRTVISEYLQKQRAVLSQNYHKPTIINDTDDVGKLAAIAEAFKCCKSIKIDQLRLGKSKLPEHLLIKTPQQNYAIGFLNVGGTTFTSKIKNFNQLVITCPNIRFCLIRDQREPCIAGKVGRDEIEKLKFTLNGSFQIMGQGDRVNFELIYNLITDIQEKDLEVNLVEALLELIAEMEGYWLIKLFT